MHQLYGATDLLAAPEPPGPEPRPPRQGRRRGFVAVLVAAAVVLLCTNGAVAYYGYRISLDEKSESVTTGP